ncbi:hypothetical protein TWF506_004802 [Arthrobotrys conoides]|uniref:Uncharacterized protein n=1 Tax=Arthrobotrys conoides TaxID=74498 RepID=A0AAN8RP53_9PEZI
MSSANNNEQNDNPAEGAQPPPYDEHLPFNWHRRYSQIPGVGAHPVQGAPSQRPQLRIPDEDLPLRLMWCKSALPSVEAIGDWHTGIEMLLQIIEISKKIQRSQFSDEYKYQQQLAAFYYNCGNWTSALAALEKAKIAKMPPSQRINAHHMKSISLLHLQRLDEAETACHTALKLAKTKDQAGNEANTAKEELWDSYAILVTIMALKHSFMDAAFYKSFIHYKYNLRAPAVLPPSIILMFGNVNYSNDGKVFRDPNGEPSLFRPEKYRPRHSLTYSVIVQYETYGSRWNWWLICGSLVVLVGGIYVCGFILVKLFAVAAALLRHLLPKHGVSESGDIGR